jgi:PAS domain S-box-containing protein
MVDGACSELHLVNSADVEVWGDSIETLREDPESFLQFVHPEDRDIAVASMERLSAGDADEVEYRIVRPDGETRWIRGDSKPILDTDGSVSRIVGYVQDVTERKERERELRREERRYQAIFNDPNILVGLIDTDGTVLELNDTATAYVDATPEELTGEPFWETPWFTHSASLRAEVRSWIDRAADGEYVEFEADLRRPDGEPYTVQGVFRPVTDDDGEVVSLLISDRDITEQKAHERELERTSALLSTLFETLPVGVLAEDGSRNVLSANERMFELFDLPGTPEDVVGTDCAALAADVSHQFADPEGFEDRIEVLVGTREPVSDEEISLADGGTYTRSYVPIDLPDGQGHLWVYRETT